VKKGLTVIVFQFETWDNRDRQSWVDG